MSIKKMRERSGLSQYQVADRLKITQGAISHWESGICNPSAEILLPLSKLLGCTVEELLTPDCESEAE